MVPILKFCDWIHSFRECLQTAERGAEWCQLCRPSLLDSCEAHGHTASALQPVYEWPSSVFVSVGDFLFLFSHWEFFLMQICHRKLVLVLLKKSLFLHTLWLICMGFTCALQLCAMHNSLWRRSEFSVLLLAREVGLSVLPRIVWYGFERKLLPCRPPLRQSDGEFVQDGFLFLVLSELEKERIEISFRDNISILLSFPISGLFSPSSCILHVAAVGFAAEREGIFCDFRKVSESLGRGLGSASTVWGKNSALSVEESCSGARTLGAFGGHHGTPETFLFGGFLAVCFFR